jgi:hypothetical protein
MVAQRPKQTQDRNRCGSGPRWWARYRRPGGQVARLGLQPLQPLVLARSAQRPARLLNQRLVVLGVAASNLDGVGQ